MCRSGRPTTSDRRRRHRDETVDIVAASNPKEEKIVKLSNRRWRSSLVLALAMAMALSACGTDEGDGPPTAEDCETTDEVRLQLQWVAQSQFAGYYVAKDLGFYEDECLDVEILEGAVEIVPQTVLASGGAEFGLAWVPKALVSREQGADIVNIAQTFERSGTLEVSFADSGIESPEDWAGKKVGNWGFGNEFELTAAIEKFGVEDVELVGQNFDMVALLNGEIDAAEAMIYNEYAQVLEAVNPDTGELYQPEDLNVIDFNDPAIGTAMLQDAVWVNREWIETEGNEEIAVRFLRASFRGWIHCLDNFQECVDVVLDNGSTLGSSHQAWQLNEILALIFPASNGIGVMNESLWDQTVDVATSQIAELEGVTIGDEAYRADLAQQAVDDLEAEGLDVDGSSYERRDVELLEGGE
jgi:NitT/TauT family transport system substrate-binding protein